MDIIKISVLGIAGVLLAIPLRRERGEYGLFISITVCICIFFYILTKVETVLNFISQLQSMLPVDGSYIRLVLKMIGITYVAEFAMDICGDAGYVAVGKQIEIFAKLSILVVSVPVLTVFIDTIGSFL